MTHDDNNNNDNPPTTDTKDATTISSSAMTEKHHSSGAVELVRLDLENITYAPQTKSGQGTTTVLSNITTSIAPYQLTAWMGPSGSGKTSLISVAANLLANPETDISSGQIRINGDAGTLPKRLVGVVWQDDLLLSNLTVEETIFFSARLKTSCTVSDESVRQLVQDTMEELGLIHVRNSFIGTSTGGAGARGISGGERKRVAVASELVVRPSLLLLDEPTSGLDATTAWSLIATLQQLAHHGGQAIAVVIHQPRTEIFNMFDHLLMLNHGKTVYDGPPKQARTYLESIPSVTPLPPETGIADWIMDIIKEDDEKSKDNNGTSLLASHWCEKQQQQQLPNTAAAAAAAAARNTDVDITKPESNSSQDDNQSSNAPRENEHPQKHPPTLRKRMSSLHELQKSPNYVTPFGMQLKLLTQRTLKQMRGEKLTKTSILLTFAYTFFSCLFWWQLPDNTGRIYERNSLLFFMLIAQSNGIVTTSVSVFQKERALLSRERAKKLYGVLPFFIAKTCSDMTNNVFLPCLYGAITYYAAGFRPDITHFLKFVLIFYLSMSAAQSMGLFLSVLIPSMAIALILAPPITLFFMIMGGFYIPFESMHVGVRWLSWLSFARYGYSSMLVNEYGGRDVPCGEDVAISIGGESGECPVSGEDVLSSLGITGASTNYWFGVLVITLLQVAFRVASYVVLRRATGPPSSFSGSNKRSSRTNSGNSSRPKRKLQLLSLVSLTTGASSLSLTALDTVWQTKPVRGRGQAACSSLQMVQADDIPGKEIAAAIRAEIREEIDELQTQGQQVPGLAVVLVGSRRDSQTYVNMKTKACTQAGIKSFQFDYEDTVAQDVLMDKVAELNADPAVHGILIQLPLPGHIDQVTVLNSVDPEKDVDGLHPVNVAKLAMLQSTGSSAPSSSAAARMAVPASMDFSIPCTPLGCMELLARSGVEISGKHAVVVGRSNLVGLPMFHLLLAADATTTMVHSRTKNIEQVVKQGDIVVAAVGRAQMVKKEWLKEGAVVIDVGINSVDIEPVKPGGKTYKLVGDVDYENAREVCSKITPVPGGVGPMTIALLLRNTLNACKRSQALAIS